MKCWKNMLKYIENSKPQLRSDWSYMYNKKGITEIHFKLKKQIDFKLSKLLLEIQGSKVK